MQPRNPRQRTHQDRSHACFSSEPQGRLRNQRRNARHYIVWAVFALSLAGGNTGCGITTLQTKAPATKAHVETMPDIEQVDHLGRHVSLSKALAKGPVVIVFYRGHW